jgi:apolipoprotein N-acyltransferase
MVDFRFQQYFTRPKEHPTSVKLPASYVLAVLSGFLMMLSMPSYDLPYLAWFGLVPLLISLKGKNALHSYLLINVCTAVWSIGTHLWYPSIFGWSGYLIMVAGGLYYGAAVKTGYDMSRRIGKWYGIFALPVTFGVFEWIKTVIPFTKTWWIELLAKSQWTVPSNLQLLSVTGFVGLTFIIMLTNVALAQLLASLGERRKLPLLPALLLLVPVANAVFGAILVKNHAEPRQTIRIGANVDLVNQDAEVIASGGQNQAGDGYLADTPEMQRKIFDINKELSAELLLRSGPVDVLVWGENEFIRLDDADMIRRLAAFAEETGAYIAVDGVWETGGAMHDTAYLMSPAGEEAGRTAKIFTLWGEEAHGFSPGPRDYRVHDTELGRIALAVCWDRHDPSILRGYARNGARLALIPADDDFNGDSRFPYFAASDAVFRAVENRLAIGSGSTSGIAQVITPYGEMTAMSGVNERQAIVGTTFVTESPTFYTRYGDVFAYLLGACFVIMLIISERNKKKLKPVSVKANSAHPQ